MSNKREFTAAEDRYLVENYLTVPIRHLAKKMGIGRIVIKRRMRELNLVVPDHVKAERVKSSHFDKGHVPYTKGKKQVEFMSPEAIERTSRTRFKKGDKPHNYKPLGYEANRLNYQFVKVAEGQFIQKHRLLWEEKNGPIPAGYVLVFKDRNPANICLENLELISYQENMLRNSVHDIPEEVIKPLAILNQLKRKIETVEDGQE